MHACWAAQPVSIMGTCARHMVAGLGVTPWMVLAGQQGMGAHC